MIIQHPEAAKLSADPCRRSMLHNFRHYEMTPYQLSKVLNKSISSIIHHPNTLEKTGLVEQTRRLVKGNLIEKSYRATAKSFIDSYTLREGIAPRSEDIARWSEEVYKNAITGLVSSAMTYKRKKRIDRWDLLRNTHT